MAMAFPRRDWTENGNRLDEGAIYLRHPEARDYLAWSNLRGASRAFLTPWEPSWPEDELSRASFRYKLRRYGEDIRDGRGYPFFVFRREDDRLVGGATLAQVRRGAALSCTMGYWIGEAFQRRGYTRSAVEAMTRFAFDDLGLHRIDAACQPENAPSRALLEKAGFVLEGHARAYLKIDGAWRDHLLFARISERSL